MRASRDGTWRKRAPPPLTPRDSAVSFGTLFGRRGRQASRGSERAGDGKAIGSPVGLLRPRWASPPQLQAYGGPSPCPCHCSETLSRPAPRPPPTSVPSAAVTGADGVACTAHACPSQPCRPQPRPTAPGARRGPAVSGEPCMSSLSPHAEWPPGRACGRCSHRQKHLQDPEPHPWLTPTPAW